MRIKWRSGSRLIDQARGESIRAADDSSLAVGGLGAESTTNPLAGINGLRWRVSDHIGSLGGIIGWLAQYNL